LISKNVLPITLWLPTPGGVDGGSCNVSFGFSPAQCSRGPTTVTRVDR